MAADKYGFVEVGGLSKITNASGIDLLNVVGQNYHIRATSGDLILSSTNGIGSRLFTSGTISSSLAIHSAGNMSCGLQMVVGQTLRTPQVVATTYILSNDGTSNYVGLSQTHRQLAMLSNWEFQWKTATTGDASTRTGNIYGLILLNSGTLALSSSAIGSPRLTALHGELILSSTAGSVVAFSASQDFTNIDKPYHIRAVNNELILSSSGASLSGAITISGNLSLPALNTFLEVKGTSNRGYRLGTAAGFSTIGAFLYGEGGYRGATLFLDADYMVANGGGSYEMGFGRSYAGGLLLSSNHRITWNSSVLLGGSVNGKVLVGRQDSGSIFISGGLGQNAIVAKDADLIFSSSATSVVAISGNLKFGSFTGSADVVVTGWVLVTDSTGTARKLAVV